MNQCMPLSIAFVGWENGDILIATSGHGIACRHSSTNNNLVAYNTTTDSSGATVRDAVVANHGSFSATGRAWYKAGRDCGRYNNSRYGKTCISPTYADVSTGSLLLTLVQPFYDDNYTFLGSHRSVEGALNHFVWQECLLWISKLN